MSHQPVYNSTLDADFVARETEKGRSITFVRFLVPSSSLFFFPFVFFSRSVPLNLALPPLRSAPPLLRCFTLCYLSPPPGLLDPSDLQSVVSFNRQLTDCQMFFKAAKHRWSFSQNSFQPFSEPVVSEPAVQEVQEVQEVLRKVKCGEGRKEGRWPVTDSR